MSEDYVIGADIGGTNARVALLDGDLNILAKETARVCSFKTAGEFFTELAAMVLRADPGGTAGIIGMALPIPWKKRRRVIVDATNVPFLENVELDFVRGCFPDRALYFENDVNVIAALEADRGVSAGLDYSVYVTVSTGIGGGVVAGGRVCRGAHGYAGEIGGIPMYDPQEGWSTLEGLCSGQALDAIAEKLYGSGASASVLFEKYKTGDRAAAGVVSLWKERLSSGLAAVIQVLDPETVVLGGSVILCQPWLVAELEAETARRVFGRMRETLKFSLCRFGADEGLIGAAYYAQKHWRADNNG